MKAVGRGRKGDLCSVTCAWQLKLINQAETWWIYKIYGSWENTLTQLQIDTTPNWPPSSYITPLKLSGCLWENLLQHVRGKQSLWPLNWALSDQLEMISNELAKEMGRASNTHLQPKQWKGFEKLNSQSHQKVMEIFVLKFNFIEPFRINAKIPYAFT